MRVRKLIAKHTFDIHAECPLVQHKQFDYYKVCVQTEDLIDANALDRVMDSVRGIRATQEDIASIIEQQLPRAVLVEVSGRHSQNSETIVFGSGKKVAI